MVEELITGPQLHNMTVRIVSADFHTIYTVDNIRELGKNGDSDRHQDLILEAVTTKYAVLFD